MRTTQAQPAQLGEIKRLLDVCFGASAWSDASVRSQLEKADSRCFVAEEDGCIIGFLAFEQVLDEGNIVEVAVHPQYRRRGIAKGLILSAVTDISLKEIFLEVRESNRPALCLYESLGFEAVGVRRDYYDDPKENAIIMRKIL